MDWMTATDWQVECKPCSRIMDTHVTHLGPACLSLKDIEPKFNAFLLDFFLHLRGD